MTMRDFGECECAVTDPKIVLSEKKSKITFLNKSRARVRKIEVDGCAIKTGKRCDYLVIDGSGCERFVELKGSDVREAIRQLETSFQISEDAQKHPKCSYVIHAQYSPSLNPFVQKSKKRFFKSYRSTLEVRPSGFEVDLEVGRR